MSKQNIETSTQTFPSFDKLKTTLLLGAVSAGAYMMQKLGMTHDIPSPGQEITESLSHPALGYLGAWVGAKAVGFANKKVGTAMLGGATGANFFAEYVQAQVASSPEAHFLAPQNFGETSKDYLFALGGMTLFAVQHFMKKEETE